jgi:hypothetical protein
MNDALLIQQIYPDTPGVEMLELNVAHNTSYCNSFNIDYWHKVENSIEGSDPLKGSWSKVELMRQGLEAGYDSVIWLDADTIICDLDTDLRDGVQLERIGACWHRIPQLSHWNVGALYLDNCEAVRLFVDQWLAQYPGANDGWLEQGVFNRLAKESRTVVTLSDRWNATLDVSMVPDAVVLGFHGQGDTPQRIKIMQQAYERLFAVDLVHTLGASQLETIEATGE